VRGGDRADLEVGEGMLLEVGDAGAFEYSLDGVPGRRLGGDGEVVRVRIDRGNLAEFLSR
jgi:hypothetical protein